MDKTNNINDVEKTECVGCTACVSVCPKNCIKMKYDDEGFLFPNVDVKECINCGACSKVCQAKQKIQLNAIKDAYVAVNNNMTDYMSSTSGGIFPILAYEVLKKNGYVCGAIVNENLEIKHIVTNQEENIENMKGSKYVQSNLDNCYRKIKKLLEENEVVLFTGSPCQVAGLRLFLKKEYDNLFCIDIVCHGVPSPKFLETHIKRIYGNVKKIRFREKNKFEGSVYKLALEDGRKRREIYSYKDAYYSAFMNGLSFRESCYNCNYAVSSRCGDITLGDCASNKEYKGFNYGTTLSSIFINTDKGEKMWECIKSRTNYEKENIQLEIKLNHQLHEPVKRPIERDHIYYDLNSLSTKDFNEKYIPKTGLKFKVIKLVKGKIPLKIKAKLKGYRIKS